ncbi:type VI secretion system baseplate subunit TssG [Marinimicrobium alkaliphilum]|uniref:type VI secretion system baseplate subunit TssG n=1 Tax=Marinimicrobium alkaliphilum TaxID=2202654 RepID=UPI000DBACD38|nr:type VI secretion system baseplate subunit TssG [Marinimicrobium alkaliphilum]
MNLLRELQRRPENFSFLQSMRLLEYAGRERDPDGATLPRHHRVGTGVDTRPPTKEPVRLHGHHSLGFPHAEVGGVTERNGQWRLQANVMSLGGPLGPLPFHYTELVLARQKAKDPALMQFLDLFNHRAASLFWRAASKYKLPLAYERARRYSKDNPHIADRHTEVLLSLMGLSPRLLRDHPTVPAESLIHYGGLLTQKVRTASNLKQIIGSRFKIPVQIEEFSGTWCEVLQDMRCQLPSKTVPKGRNNQLGRSTLLGQKSWLAQNKIGIKLGPLDRAQYRRFAPDSQALAELRALAALYLGPENDFELVLDVRADALPTQLRLGTAQPYQLGWNSRLPPSIYRTEDPHASQRVPLSPEHIATPSKHHQSSAPDSAAEGHKAA